MASIDWNKLSPHRPLDAGDARYVPRPNQGGERLAKMLMAGFAPLVVAGPVGCGKSTELATAAGVLKEQGAKTILLHLDRTLNMANVSVEDVLDTVFRECEVSLQEDGPKARRLLYSRIHDFRDPTGRINPGMHRDALLEVLRLMSSGGAAKPVLLLDGLEKCSEEIARAIVRMLLEFRDEAALAIVVPPSLVTGPAGYDVIANATVFPVRPVPVWKKDGADAWRIGRGFLNGIARRRLNDPNLDLGKLPGFESLLDRAAFFSGGVPRVFLQLVRDAAGYASLAGQQPAIPHLEDAISAQCDSLRRILQARDLEILMSIDGSDGLELAAETKVRYFIHGLLLEYEADGRIIVHPAPLLTPLFQPLWNVFDEEYST